MQKQLHNTHACFLLSFIRGFLSSGSVHPVRLVQDFLLEGLAENWSVSMATETIPFLLRAKQLQACCCEVDTTHCYWIHLLQKDPNSDHTSTDKAKDPLTFLDSRGCTDAQDTPSTTRASSNKVDRVRSKGAESLRSACSPDVDPEVESGVYVLRPSLFPQMEELLTKKEELINSAGIHGEIEGNNKSAEVEGHNYEGPLGGCNGVASLIGISGLVFRNVSISLWALPSFHELLLRGVFPSECKPITLLGERLETLLAPFGVSLVEEQGGLCLTAQPIGLVGRVFASSASNNVAHVSVNVSLNLDILAVLLFSLPNWRMLWSHDPHFSKQFALRPSPGQAFQPFSLFPEHISFDISFWTGSVWEERKFHAVVREASHGTVEQVKLIDRFSHPDLSQTSYCYRLTYHSHTHALSHTQALKFHKHLESLLSSRLQVTIR